MFIHTHKLLISTTCHDQYPKGAQYIITLVIAVYLITHCIYKHIQANIAFGIPHT